MKRMNLSFLGLMIVALVAFTACGGAETDADAASESLATAPSNDAPAATTANNAAEVAKPTGPTTTISFEQSTFDFGTVDSGEKVSHIYKFTNTGNEPLVISNAKGSCGCTVPQWPKTPIPPGETGEIRVEFDSKGKSGKQTKRVTITANTDPAQTFLTITGNINKVDAPTGG
ncbi:MAG: DUF1573 domain-containing protein [Saprospiraceae bacterium]|nr:DUF1573 domain-containing protein [Saprospiraceae bacterium]